MNDEFLKELQTDFICESLTLIDRFEAVLLNSMNETITADLVNELFRIAHTLKGGSAAVGFAQESKFVHKGEDYLSPFRTKVETFNPTVARLMLEFSDHFKDMLFERSRGGEKNWNPDEYLKKLTKETISSDDGIKLSTKPEAEQPATVVGNLSENEKKPIEPKLKAGNTTQQIKIDVGRVETIFNSIGDVVSVKNQIKASLQGLKLSKEAEGTLDDLERVVRDLYDKALGLKMTSLQPVFQRMKRTLFDLATKLNKKVNVVVVGEETEIDRNLIEKIPDPLIHLIRNAIDHGVESEQERQSAGKSAVATVEIKAYYKSSAVVIEIKDDGKGINKERVFKKAQEKNIILADAKIADFSDQQIFQLIFAPGFSTADKVSDLSGRGVGLDVVKTTVAELRGSLSIESTEGAGTCFKMSLPVSTSLVDGIKFSISDLNFVVPNSAIQSISQVQRKDLNFYGENQLYLNCFENAIPAIDMSLFLKQTAINYDRKMIAVIGETIFGPISFLFESVQGQCQAVVRPLPEGQSSENFLGAMVNDEGAPEIILDLNKIGTQAMSTSLKENLERAS